MKDGMEKFLLKSLERSSQAVFFFRKDENVCFFANKQALCYFDIGDGTVSLEAVFRGGVDAPFRDGLLKEQLEQEEFAFLYNVQVYSNKGIPKLCDIQIAYADDEKESFFIELYFKEDKRMDMALHQIKFSQRAEGILNFDEKLSVVSCNEPFYAVFEADEERCYSHYGNVFSNGFQPEIREKLLREIHENLNKSPNYMTKVKVVTSTGEENWYSLELQRRILDETGIDKVMAYLVNIENLVEMEEGYHSMNRQFLALQELSDNTLFMVNIPEKKLISRDPKMLELGLRQEVVDFPESVLSMGVIHAGDWEKYRAFARSALSGEGGETEIRLLMADESVRYRKILWTPVPSDTAQVTEVIGKMVDMQELVDKQNQLDDISQYFNIIQTMCQGILYRFDIKNRVLYRNEETAKVYHVPVKTENYPPPLFLESIFHPEDVLGFQDFMDAVLDGREGTHTARLRNGEGEFEHHAFTFKAMRGSDGVLREMIGSAVNIHQLKETEQELLNINQYFHVIQEESKCLLYRFDIKHRILYRNEAMAKRHGLPCKVENYPNPEAVKKVVYAEDIQGYTAFMERVLAGEEGNYVGRLLTPEDSYEYYSVNFRAIKNPDGSIHEMIGTALNIHELKEKEQELQAVNRHFSAYQQLSEDLLFRVDIENKLLIKKEDVSSNLLDSAAKFPEDILENGSVFAEDAHAFELFAKKILTGVADTVEVRMKLAPEEPWGFRRIICTPVVDHGKVTEMVGKLVDVQVVKELEEKANYDALTNLLNKRAMSEYTSEIILQSHVLERHALLFVDLDDFKYVNDNLGHTFGDYLLSELGRRLQESVRSHDLVGRVGGDEFIIFLRDAPSTELLLGKAKTVLETISEEFSLGEKCHSIHGSLGIALFPDHGSSYEELYRCGDLALYHSKQHGKNIVTLYTEDLQEKK